VVIDRRYSDETAFNNSHSKCACGPLHDLLDVEGCGLLSRGKRFEGGKELPNKLLSRYEQEGMIKQPIVVFWVMLEPWWIAV
jgi:hypothetical protein